MQAAIIPPIPHLDEVKGRDFHLVLTHLCEQSEEYRNFYLQESIAGSYIILDNSAHERTHGQPIAELLQVAESIHADEVVIPDKLFDCKETTLSAFDSFLSLLQYTSVPMYRWMLVPQGRTKMEWEECLSNFSLLLEVLNRKAQGILYRGITLGISKDYEVWHGGLPWAVKELVVPWADRWNAEIHLLGWGRNLWALNQIVKEYGNRIRSIDTAKPFVYGASGIHISPVIPVPPYPKRSETYFNDALSGEALKIALGNVACLDRVVLNGKTR